MTREETVRLVQFIIAVCPQQKINKETAILWHDVIGHLDFEAARNAVIAVKHSQAFVDPSDIIREVARAKGMPYDRTPAEAIATVNLREPANLRSLAVAEGSQPPAEYQALKDAMITRIRERDEAELAERQLELNERRNWIASPEAQRKAEAHLAHAIHGAQPAAGAGAG